MKRLHKFAVVPSLLSGVTALLVGALANAQPAPAPGPPGAAADPTAPAAPPPADVPPAEPATPPPPAATETVVPAPSAEAAPAPEAAAAAKPWYDSIKLNAFVDGYASLNYNFPKPQNNINAGRAFDVHNGFSLAWAGINATYDPDPVGGTISLRFGPSTNLYSGTDTQYGLQYLKQAFASWKPGGADGILQLDFGKFDTIYGAEVAESQLNQNYTRGALFWLVQPLFHTGLRATIQASKEVAVKALVVNGWNNTIDNNAGKSYGLQLALTPADGLAVNLGWIGGPEQNDIACSTNPAGETTCLDRGGANDFKAWKHLIDFVLTYNITESLGLVLNADYGTEGVRSADVKVEDVVHQKFYGGALGLRYQLDPTWALAVRGEYIGSPDGYAALAPIPKDGALATGTLTIEAKPTANLILRLDTRGDFIAKGDNKDVFPKKTGDSASSQITSTLGVVVTTN